jgi:hypothetical protein
MDAEEHPSSGALLVTTSELIACGASGDGGEVFLTT